MNFTHTTFATNKMIELLGESKYSCTCFTKTKVVEKLDQAAHSEVLDEKSRENEAQSHDCGTRHGGRSTAFGFGGDGEFAASHDVGQCYCCFSVRLRLRQYQRVIRHL